MLMWAVVIDTLEITLVGKGKFGGDSLASRKERDRRANLQQSKPFNAPRLNKKLEAYKHEQRSTNKKTK